MIELIDFKLVGNSEKAVQVTLDSKNLIITGGNGCGKTRFLRQLHAYLQGLFDRQIQPENVILNTLKQSQDQLSNMNPSGQHYSHYQKQVETLTIQLKRIQDERVVFDNLDELFLKLHEGKFILRFFEANRLSQQLVSNGQIESIASVKEQGKSDNYQADSSNKFEKYLVSYYNYGSYVIAREQKPEKAKHITEWFKKVEDDLRDLFEDPKLILDYNAEEQAFYIKQNGKDPYGFKDLSSGYSSILSIYADLLMKVELREVPANEITGFVLIDEIDAHLHVSLQRKIFSFFDRSFPKIQFIVTTHSPFVVQSVNDSIIYDLSKMEPLEDLSMYSYESILKGLLGVESTSDLLNSQLDEIAELINQKSLNIKRLTELVDKIQPHEKQLDSRSRAFLLLGKNAILDSTDGEEEQGV